MMILEEDANTDHLTVDILLAYEYQFYTAFTKLMGLKPLPKTQWLKTMTARRKKTLPALKKVNQGLPG